MILKLSFWSHFQKLWMLLIYCIIMVFLLWAFDFQQGMFLFVLVMGGVLVVPTLMVHLDHYKYCEKKTVVLLDDMIKVEGKDPVCTICVRDITCITVYMSGTRALNLGTQSFPFENYFYCKIDTESNGSVFLSCLFSDKLDKLLEERYNVPFVRERKYYPIIS